MTELFRTEATSEAITAQIVVYLLTILTFFFGVLTVLGLVNDWNAAWISLWIGGMFIALTALVDVYRKHFLPDEMVKKTRLPKVIPRRELRE